MGKKLNYYELLEIYPAATQEEIDNAFRLMLYKYHPDHNPDRPDWAHERTSETVEAYKILSDPLRRKIYNFLIFATLRAQAKEEKFNFLQMAQKKKYEEALEIFRDAVNTYDVSKKDSLLKFQQAYGTYKLPDAVYNIGVIYTNSNKLSEALHAFKEAAKLDETNQHYNRTVDRIQELMRDIDRAKR